VNVQSGGGPPAAMNWHEEVLPTSGFDRRERSYKSTVESSEVLARLVAHHLPFYELLQPSASMSQPSTRVVRSRAGTLGVRGGVKHKA
jgi:hypothetical protein